MTHSDLAGFSRREQQLLAWFALGQQGKLTKLPADGRHETDWAALLCFRIACLFYRRRFGLDIPSLDLKRISGGFTLGLPDSWLSAHPLTEHGLLQERQEWAKVGFDLQLKAV